jgi:putative SbcD/Mre11-related phosphoesterase
MIVLADWLLTPQRVAIHLPTGTAVAADLHLGYSEARRQAGEAVPAVRIEEELEDLGRACQIHEVRRLLIAGDLLEDGRTGGALEDFRSWLRQREIEWTGLVPGNHDEPADAFADAGLEVFPTGVELGSWHVVHGHEKLPAGRVVQGHEHPCLAWGDGQRVPCFLIAESRLILPAYSRDAAGVNILRNRRWSTYRCCAVAGESVLDLGPLLGLRRPLRSLGGR